MLHKTNISRKVTKPDGEEKAAVLICMCVDTNSESLVDQGGSWGCETFESF